jgi:hypothetical protein
VVDEVTVVVVVVEGKDSKLVVMFCNSAITQSIRSDDRHAHNLLIMIRESVHN